MLRTTVAPCRAERSSAASVHERSPADYGNGESINRGVRTMQRTTVAPCRAERSSAAGVHERSPADYGNGESINR